MVALGIGGVSRHSYAAGRHYSEIDNAPFGPVFGYQRDTVTIFKAQLADILGKQADVVCHFPPTLRNPFAALLGSKERCIALLVCALQEKLDQTICIINI